MPKKAKKCQICQARFQGRRDAKTCSSTCRKRMQRNLAKVNSAPVKATVAESLTDKAARLESALGLHLQNLTAQLLPKQAALVPVLADQRGIIPVIDTSTEEEEAIEVHKPATVIEPSAAPLASSLQMNAKAATGAKKPAKKAKAKAVEPELSALGSGWDDETPKPPKKPPTDTADEERKVHRRLKLAMAGLLVLILLLSGGLVGLVNHKAGKQAANLAQARNQYEEQRKADQERIKFNNTQIDQLKVQQAQTKPQTVNNITNGGPVTTTNVYQTTGGGGTTTDCSATTEGCTPAAGSSHYIQNGTDQQTANFNISGTGTLGGLVLTNTSNSNSLTLQAGATASNLTFTLPTADGGSGQCLQTNGAGAWSFANCTAGGGSVSSINGLAGTLFIQGTANQIGVFDNGTDTITLSLPQDINTTSSPTFANLTVSTAITQGGNAVCDISNNCNYAPASGSGNYINNGTSPQTANFNVTGAGTVGGILGANAGGKTAITIGDTGAQLSGLTIGGDTNLYRAQAAQLRTDGTLNVNGLIVLGSGGSIISSAGNGKTTLQLSSTGSNTGLTLGGDTTLFRANTNQLRTDGQLQSLLDTYARLGAASQVGIGALGPTSEAAISFGSAQDTKLYRASAGVLQTAGQLSLGRASTATGQLNFFGSGSANSIALVGPTAPSSGLTLTLPNESGTLCSTGSVCTGYAAASGSGSYIQNGTGQQASSNFNISGSGTLGGNLTVNAGSAATSGNVFGSSMNLNALPGSASTGFYYASQSVATYNGTASTTGSTVGTFNRGIQNAGSGVDVATVYGTYGQAVVQGAGTVGTLAGVNSLATNIAASTGTVQSAIGLRAQVQNNSTAGANYVQAYGVIVQAPVASATGTIGTNYGVYIAKQKATGIGTAYGLYQADAGDLNYFAGNVGIGGIPTSGGANLQVTGTGSFSGVLTANAGAAQQIIIGVSSANPEIRFGSALDANLYRSGVSTLTTDGNFSTNDGQLKVFRSSVANAITTSVTNDANSRFIIKSDGSLSWGPGSAAVDTTLYRSTTNTLKTDSNLVVVGSSTFNSGMTAQAGITGTRTSLTAVALGAQLNTDSVQRFGVLANGTAQWSSGTATADTNLYRVSAGVLQTDGQLNLGKASNADGKLVFNNSSNSNTLTLQSGATGGNLVFTLPTADGANGDCLQTSGGGVLSFGACGGGGGGGGVPSVNGVTAAVTIQGTANQINVTGSTVNPIVVSLPNDIIFDSGAVSMATTGANGFTFKPGTDAASAFKVQKADGTTNMIDINTSSNIVSVLDAPVTGAITLGSLAMSGTYTQQILIGSNLYSNPNSTSMIFLGNPSASSTTAIRGGSGGSAISIQASSSGGIIIGTASANVVTVGSTSGAASLTLQSGTAGTTFKSTGAASSYLFQDASSNTAVTISTANITGTLAGADAIMKVKQDSGSGRSISASGLIVASGADYAEYIPWSGPKPAQGSVVTYNGSAYIVSSPATAGFVGNDKFSDGDSILVTFAGQVPVRVSGPVSVGDILIDNGDGTARAVAPGAASIAQLFGKLGIAQEASGGGGMVRAAIGTTLSDASSIALGGGSSSFADLNVSGLATIQNLTVVGSATIAELHVTGSAEFAGNITVGGDLILGPNSHVLGNASTRGSVTVLAGATTATYTFPSAYTAAPNVVATPTGDPGGSYWVSDITPGGFTVHLSAPAASDLKFNFQAQQ